MSTCSSYLARRAGAPAGALRAPLVLLGALALQPHVAHAQSPAIP